VQPGAEGNPGSEKPNEISTDTPATAESKPAESPKPKIETQKPKDTRSDFAKAQERKDTSWKALQADREAFAKEKAAIAAERALHQREVEAWKVRQAKAANKYSPEEYDIGAERMTQIATSHDQQAEAFEARAEKLEGDGEFSKAEQAKAKARELRESAAGQRIQAKNAKEYAAHLRQNPDPTLEQITARNKQAARDYTLKAVEQWPEFGKQGSEFQQKAAGYLQNLKQQGMDANENPALWFHVAQFVAAESAAARVPAMEKELGETRARVKELELLVTPGGGQAAAQVQPLKSTLTDEEELEALRREAMTMSR
jgi:hypothetical protein